MFSSLSNHSLPDLRTGKVTNTEFCLTGFTVANIAITYQSVSMNVVIPPLAINQDVSQKVNTKLLAKLPGLDTSVETKINSAAAKKLSVCKAFS
jgi:hypothetical protein